MNNELVPYKTIKYYIILRMLSKDIKGQDFVEYYIFY